MPQIELTRVVKDYQIRVRDEQQSRIAQFVSPRYGIKRAVDEVTFSIERGEMVGYIGPNGAGKSTTIKMLTGILMPTTGAVRVFGRDPSANRRENAMRMGVVFGQRSQLLWDLPVADTMDLFKTMYRMSDRDYAGQRDMLVDMLDMGSFLNQATRQLSLGQRMRANLALCFLYKPEVVYLDEPTIGLDVLVKDRIRDFLRQINRDQGTTVLLTTHDTADIERVTDRLMLIDQGKLLFDGTQNAFKHQYQGDAFLLEVEFQDARGPLELRAFDAVRLEGAQHAYRVRYDAMSPGEAISRVASAHRVQDIGVREVGLEDILKQIYAR